MLPPRDKTFSTLFAVTSLAGSLAAQLQWQAVSSAHAPAPRYGHTTTRYGTTFGGRDATQAFADTWVFQGGLLATQNDWLPMPTAVAPSARHGHAMDEDLMFGGENASGQRNNETWRLTSNWATTPPGQPFTSNWLQLSPTHAPSPRSGHALAYEVATSTTAVLFGGRTDVGLSAETWFFAGGDWQLLPTPVSPPAREGHRLLSASDGYFLFGGRNDNHVFDDVWRFDGATWHQLPSMPFAASGAAVALLGFERRRHVFVGGIGPSGQLRTELHERAYFAGTWFPQPNVDALPAREMATVFEHLHQMPSFDLVTTAVVFGGRNAQGQALGDTYQLVPTNVAASFAVGIGCGPGQWSNNGPELWAPTVILGNTGTAHVFTQTPEALVVLGAQLGAAPAPSCSITVVPEVIWFGLSSSAGIFQLALPIPFAEGLRGAELSLQSLVFEPAAVHGIALSAGGRMRIGD